MDFISSCNMKAQLKSSVQEAANKSHTILGEAYHWKYLWRSDDYLSQYIEKLVVRDYDHIYYQIQNEPGKFHSIDKNDDVISTTEFYAPSYLYSIRISYPEPHFLTLEDTVIKTEIPYQYFTVAEHNITKKIYFIASNKSFYEGESLYAADVDKGSKEVVAEKVDIGGGTVTTLVVNQLTGDIIFAGCDSDKEKSLFIETFKKLQYLNQMMASVGVSSSEETVIRDSS